MISKVESSRVETYHIKSREQNIVCEYLIEIPRSATDMNTRCI